MNYYTKSKLDGDYSDFYFDVKQGIEENQISNDDVIDADKQTLLQEDHIEM